MGSWNVFLLVPLNIHSAFKNTTMDYNPIFLMHHVLGLVYAHQTSHVIGCYNSMFSQYALKTAQSSNILRECLPKFKANESIYISDSTYLIWSIALNSRPTYGVKRPMSCALEILEMPNHRNNYTQLRRTLTVINYRTAGDGMACYGTQVITLYNDNSANHEKNTVHGCTFMTRLGASRGRKTFIV